MDNFCGKCGEKQHQKTVTKKIEKFNIDFYYYQKKRTTHT